jgi:flagella basal body P-ring formation protein FlgA
MRKFGMVSLSTLLVTTAVGAQAPVAAAPAAAPLGVERTVPVALRALPRGTSLAASDFERTTTVVRPALRNAAAAEMGWVTRRAVSAGEALVEPAVGPPALVASGQPVTFVADHAGVRLSIRGTAASSGALGDHIWVRLDAGRRLRGVVSAPSTVSADTTSLR